MKNMEWARTQAAWVVQSCPPTPRCCGPPRLQSGQRSGSKPAAEQERAGSLGPARVFRSPLGCVCTLPKQRREGTGAALPAPAPGHPSRACSAVTPRGAEGGLGLACPCSQEVLSFAAEKQWVLFCPSEWRFTCNTGPARGPPCPAVLTASLRTRLPLCEGTDRG